MIRFLSYKPFLLPILLASLLLAGCRGMGSRTIPRDRFNYNEALSQSRNQQMLLNIVRLRYLDIPDFLAVSSVISSYSYDSDIGIDGTTTELLGDKLTGNANLRYSERPTISYTPLSGEDFSRRMLKPIPVEVVFSLGQAGWPMDVLLTITLQRINGVQNMGFGLVPSPGDTDMDLNLQFEEDASHLKDYQRVLELLLVLNRKGVLEIQNHDEDEEEASYLHFTKSSSKKTMALVDELKGKLSLSPEYDVFRVTDRMMGRKNDEITIQARSLLSIMSYLSRGIEVPKEDQAKGRVVSIPPKALAEIFKRVPIHIRSSKTRPKDPHVAVKYRNDWFYIDHSDIRSKRTFATIIVLFNLAAPSANSAAPVLTLPAGG